MFIALVGPHAIGKTTAAKRWAVRYSSLGVVHCDNNAPEDLEGVVLLEGCSALANRWLPQVCPAEVIHCYCSPETLAENMKRRCQDRGKRYREDYWTPRWLGYEAKIRMTNLLSKRLAGVKVVEFLISNKEQDWQVVDAYFGKLYRELNNALVRV